MFFRYKVIAPPRLRAGLTQQKNLASLSKESLNSVQQLDALLTSRKKDGLLGKTFLPPIKTYNRHKKKYKGIILPMIIFKSI